MPSNGNNNKLLIIAPIVFLGLLLLFVVYATHKCGAKTKPSNSNSSAKSQNKNNDEYDHNAPRKHSFCPCSGVVLDAKTGKPIAGAQVMAHAHFSGGLGIELIGEDKYEFAQTDEEGRYYIPKIRYGGVALEVSGLYFVVYKAGYVAYSNQGIFGTKYDKPDFRYKNNNVMLEKWDEKKFTKQDHVEHIEMIECSARYFSFNSPKKYKAYCNEAKEEMILACLARYKRSPRTREECESYVDRDLGLTDERK